MTLPETHTLDASLERRKIKLTVIGCGGTGSALIAGLPHLNAALQAYGHPGLQVTIHDGDRVSPTNSVRQPFSQYDVGEPKATLLTTRLNLFWSLDFKAYPTHVTEQTELNADIVVICVDTRAARRTIRKIVESSGSRVTYVLDCGNTETIGQVVLGKPANPPNRGNVRSPRLPCSWDLFPELTDAELDKDDGPSCSALESLERQGPFVNQTVATYALALLAELICQATINRHGGFIDVAGGHSTPMRISRAEWKRMGYHPHARKSAAMANAAQIDRNTESRKAA